MTTAIFREIYPFAYWMCIIAFAAFAYDKHLALCAKRRIPEAVLWLVTVLAGGFGSLCGMVIFNHKTRKKAFAIGVPVIVFLQVLLAAYILTR